MSIAPINRFRSESSLDVLTKSCHSAPPTLVNAGWALLLAGALWLQFELQIPSERRADYRQAG
jgi:hypothetical protein